jgi:M6 family metalloprotease-like protein
LPRFFSESKGGFMLRRPRLILLLFFIFSFVSGSVANAISLSPEVAKKLKAEGKFQDWLDLARSARERGVWSPGSHAPLKFSQDGALATDTLKLIVLTVDFDDNAYSRDTSEFTQLLFSRDFSYPTGSFRDYYLENSYGQLELTGGLYGWLRAPEHYAYYENGLDGLGAYPNNSQKMVEDVIYAADPYVDFAQFDHDGDGWVDGLNVIHAGPAAEDGADSAMVSHKWNLRSVITLDGVSMYEYTVSPEVRPNGDLIGIGTLCHEFGHILGAKDLYDYDGSSKGVGAWSVMAYGPFINEGRTPSHFDAYHKYKLGFSQVNRIFSNQTHVEILQAETSPVAYRLWTSGYGGSTYFLVENRQKTGFDCYLPGEGLLIYHVDENISSNRNEWCPGDPYMPHYMVALEQADGQFHFEGCFGSSNWGDAGDPFPGSSDKRAFDDTTTPDSRNYAPENATQVAVWNISDPDSVMYANLDVTWSKPCLKLQDFRLCDSLGGDDDGRPEPGETVKIYFSISNLWASLYDAYATACADTQGIYFSTDSVFLGDIASGDTVDDYANPLEFTVAEEFPLTTVSFTLSICGDGGVHCADFVKQALVGPAEVLLVDDDGHVSGPSDYAPLYQKVLNLLDLVYDIWDQQASPAWGTELTEYPMVVWFTGDHRESVLSPENIDDLTCYLNGHGRLFITSQDVTEQLASSGFEQDSLFLADYLHASFGGNCFRTLVAGVAGDPVGDSLFIHPDGPNGADNQISKDIVIPDLNASGLSAYAGTLFAPTDSMSAVRYQGSFKTVLFGFGFEAIDSSGGYLEGHYLSQPAVVMERVLDWLGSPLPFTPGDANGDGVVGPGDVVFIINYLFRSGPPPDPLEAGDCNCDGVVSPGDVVYLINYLFRSGPPPD